MIRDVDFYYDNHGRIVTTEQYHFERGYCCGSKCKHCPYWPKYQTGNKNLKKMSYVNIYLPELPILKERLENPVRKEDWLKFYNKCESLLGSKDSIEYLQAELKEFNKDRKVDSIL